MNLLRLDDSLVTEATLITHYHDELEMEMCLVAFIAIALDTLMTLRCFPVTDGW